MPLVTCKCGHHFDTADPKDVSCPACGARLKGADPEDWPEPLQDDRGSRKAVVSLLLGGVSLVASVFAGIPAMLVGVSALGDIERSEGRLRGRKTAITGIVLGAIGTALIPVAVIGAVAFAFAWDARQKANLASEQEHDLAQCRQHLRVISDAIDRYVKKHGRFPTDPFGSPLSGEGLSWRVAILPELGPDEAALYARFRLDEPWDSPSNRPLLSAMPEVFQCPAFPNLNRTWSTYSKAIGEGSVFPTQYERAWKEGVRPADVTDGPEKTLLVLESKGAVPWTSPDTALMLLNVGSHHADGQYHAIFVDGSVRVFTKFLLHQIVEALVSRAGGESIPPEGLGQVVSPGPP